GEALQLVTGGALALGAWLLPRHVAKARSDLPPAILLDFLPIVLAGTVLLAVTGRPIFTGALLFSLGAGFALSGRTQRAGLRGPVVFSEISELRHGFLPPHT